MLDFNKELEHFRFLEMDEDFLQQKNNTALVIEAFHKAYKRVGIEQNKTNALLDEILELSEEDKLKDEEIKRLHTALEKSDEEKDRMMAGLINITDHVEDLYQYAQKSEDDAWSRQIQLIWSNIHNELLAMGAVSINGTGALYNKDLNTVKAVECDRGLPDGCVLKVLQCGYMFQSRVIRKSQVIVNRIMEGEDI